MLSLSVRMCSEEIPECEMLRCEYDALTETKLLDMTRDVMTPRGTIRNKHT